MKIFLVYVLVCCTYFLDASVSVEQMLAEMTPEEKVAQLLIAHFNGEEANGDAETLIQKMHIGGIVYYRWANGLHSPKQVRHLSDTLQKLAQNSRLSIPLILCIDQEGGVVTRLTQGFTIFPGNYALAMTKDPRLANESAFSMGKELRSVGINMNLSPVVDINTNPKNPVIGIRSFGDSAQTVIPFAQNALMGYRRAGILSTLKHFPGHGDVDIDSHDDLPILKKSKKELDSIELLPFSLLAKDADAVMTAHIMVPAIDTQYCATLSKKILDILRTEMNYQGVIFSDSLIMQGLLNNCSSIDEAAVLAINAGCDLLLLGGRHLIENTASIELSVADIQRIHQSILGAVLDGKISKERLDEAVSRVLHLKERYLSFSAEIPDSLFNGDEHRALAKKIADAAIAVKFNRFFFFSPDQSTFAIFAPELIRESLMQTPFLQIGKKNFSLFFKELNPSFEEHQMAEALAQKADVLLFFSYNAWKNRDQTTLVKQLFTLNKPTILICLRDPLDASLFPNADLILKTFSPTTPSIQAAYNRLKSFSKL